MVQIEVRIKCVRLLRMNYLHILMAFVVSAVVSSFTDWYFFGILFHERYWATPGIWRQYKDKNDEMRSIMIRAGDLERLSPRFFSLLRAGRWSSPRYGMHRLPQSVSGS